ncbi:21977_t:CDS:1, partial [Gigaspora rosea]
MNDVTNRPLFNIEAQKSKTITKAIPTFLNKPQVKSLDLRSF